MSKTKEEQKSILMKYSKEEIIDAVLSEIAGFELTYVLDKLWREKCESLYSVMKQAEEKYDRAEQAYLDFEKELAGKYGKDGKINIKVVPLQGLGKLQALSMEWDKAWEENLKASKKYLSFSSLRCKMAK